MNARRQRLLKHLQAGRPVRIENLVTASADPAMLVGLALDLRSLQEEGLIQPTPYGWLWTGPSQ